MEHWIVSNRLVLINTFKSVENNQHTGFCHSHRQHSEDCQKRSHLADWRQQPTNRQHSEDCQNRSQRAAWRQPPQTCNLDPGKQVNTNAGKLPPNCPTETTRKPNGNTSGNSLISTSSQSPSPSTVWTRIPPILTLQSSKQQKNPFQEVDVVTISHTEAKPWRRFTRCWVRPERI